MVSGLRAQDYLERLKELGMTMLEETRYMADMAMVHKRMHGKDEVDQEIWFRPASARNSSTRLATDPLNMLVNHGRLDVRRNFFSIRVTQPWNSITRNIKSIKLMASFKTTYA